MRRKQLSLFDDHYEKTKVLSIPAEILRADLDDYFQAVLSAICHCYDNTEGLYPDNCSCDQREKVNESISAIINEHRKLKQKYNLH